MVAFVDAHRGTYGVEPICAQRLMRRVGLRGIVRGRRLRTTVPAPVNERPQDLVPRDFRATQPNRLWVADLTDVSTWRGVVYAAFVNDVCAARIVGWRVARAPRTDLALDALAHALQDRTPEAPLVPHSDRGVQYLAIRCTERRAEAGLHASVGRRGDAYDNALADRVIGLDKTELIRHEGPWTCLEDLACATLSWVHWYNTARLHSALGYVPPAEYAAQQAGPQQLIWRSWDSTKIVAGEPGAIQPLNTRERR
jgi:transposase InsO family protein